MLCASRENDWHKVFAGAFDGHANLHAMHQIVMIVTSNEIAHVYCAMTLREMIQMNVAKMMCDVMRYVGLFSAKIFTLSFLHMLRWQLFLCGITP